MPAWEIPLSSPEVTEGDIARVAEVLRSGRLSIGPVVEEFEREAARVAGQDFGVAVSSGTAGLHLALLALGVGPGDEVITTPFSFVASANCILYCGAKPVFVDIEPRSLNMDPAAIEAAITPRTRAILAVEVFGNPAHMDSYAAIAARHEIPLVEDCCEAIGTTLRGRPAGSFGRVGVFAFYPNKQITTGEGGMIVTSDASVADMCRSLRNHGRPTARELAQMHQAEGESGGLKGSWLRHARLGYNYRMPEINAALGLSQLRRLDEIIEARQLVARRYVERLVRTEDLIIPTIESETSMSWFVFVVRLATGYGAEERDRIIEGLRRHEIGSADYFPCIHLMPHYRALGYGPGQFPIAESVAQRTIALPFHNRLTPREIDLVVQTLELMIDRENLQR